MGWLKSEVAASALAPSSLRPPASMWRAARVLFWLLCCCCCDLLELKMLVLCSGAVSAPAAYASSSSSSSSAFSAFSSSSAGSSSASSTHHRSNRPHHPPPGQPHSHQQQQQRQEVRCGGHLRERTGVIQTPNFPRPFPVPIRCRWVIDASALNISTHNVSIVVYLTQLYATAGLTFTEFAYYESDAFHVGEALVHAVTEQNVTLVKWLWSRRPALVVDFALDRLEGNHLRVLDELLDVYGFNITYEISGRADPVRGDSCNVMTCSFVGNCFAAADFTLKWLLTLFLRLYPSEARSVEVLPSSQTTEKEEGRRHYQCACFKGFSGEDCGRGPLCQPGRHICQNGATCRGRYTSMVCGRAEYRCITHRKKKKV
ncbi:Uncharacterized protein GBIM_16812 [Gryllus bimaculatus]|nr:Uncharacterized protein GBIM_16812 [Gryllus bimaculatus]